MAWLCVSFSTWIESLIQPAKARTPTVKPKSRNTDCTCRTDDVRRRKPESADLTARPERSSASIMNRAVGSATLFSLHEGKAKGKLGRAHIGNLGGGFVESKRDVKQVRKRR